MRSLALVACFMCAAVHQSAGQAELVANFSFPTEPYNVCMKEPLPIQNTSQNALEYLWDFCPETFTEDPDISVPFSVPGLSNGWGYKVVNHGDQWTGFLVSRNTNKLFRLEFGNDPSNEPAIFDLGNPGDLLVSPQGLDIVNQNGNWYGFVGKGETTSGQIVRLDFGNDLHNDPTAVGLGTFGFSGSRFRDLKIIKQGADWMLLVILDTQNALLRINYRDSFDNTLSTDDIRPTAALAGANIPIGFSIVKYEGNWIVHTASFSNNGIQQYNFGSDILGTPSFDGSFTFTSVSRPYYIKVIRESDSFYGFVGNESKNLSIVKFGNFTSPPEQLPNSTLPRFIGFDVLKINSKNIVQGSMTGSTSFTSVTFENTSCGSPVTFSYAEAPAPFAFDVPGTFNIELMVSSSDFQRDVVSKALDVSNFEAPSLQVSHDNMCVGSPIEFAVTPAGNLNAWDWDLGNGMTSTSENPTSSYVNQGTYQVLLMATDENDCRAYDTLSLQIYEAPVAAFEVPSTLLCTNNSFTFQNLLNDTYNGHLSYQWFVDDNPVSIARDLQHTFTTTGPKDIKLVTSLPGCSNEIIKTTPSVQPGPVVDFSVTGACEGDLFSFQNEIWGPVESYLWSFDNGNTSSDPNPTEQFTSFGDYSVSLTATNAIGCENVKTRVVPVHSKPVIDFSAEGPPNACSGTSTLFTNQTTSPDGRAITEWLWDFNDSNDASPSSEREPQHIFALPDTYPVSLTAATASGCVGTKEKNITIYESPSTDFDFTPACKDVPVLFTGPPDRNIIDSYWEVGTSYYEIHSPTHIFQSAGDFPLHLRMTSANGCIGTLEQTIHVPEPLTPVFSVLKNCVDQEAILTDVTTGSESVIATEWLLNDAETFAGSPLRHKFSKQETQQVTMKVTTVSGCEYAVSRPVEIFSRPEASFSSSPPAGSYPLEVKFTNNSLGATHYLWDFADGSGATSVELSPVHTFQDQGAFEVVLTAFNAQECADAFTEVITTVAPLPDGAVEQIILAPEADGSLKLIVTIQNKGNSVLKNTPLEINFSGNLVLRQVLTEPILPATKYNFVFTRGIVNNSALRYLCVFLELENDLNPQDNRFCEEFGDKLLVLPAYPNPTKSALHAEWISGTASAVRISLLDAMGRTIFHNEMNGSAGINRQTLDLSGLPEGIYYLLTEDGLSKNYQRILVMVED